MMLRLPDDTMLQTVPKCLPSSAFVPGKYVDEHIICRVPDCGKHLCKNGCCEETKVGYNCHCSSGFQGRHCDEQSTELSTTDTTTKRTTSPTTTMSDTTISQETTTSKSTELSTTDTTTKPTTSPTTTMSDTTISQETTTSKSTELSTTDTTTKRTTSPTTTMSDTTISQETTTSTRLDASVSLGMDLALQSSEMQSSHLLGGRPLGRFPVTFLPRQFWGIL
ncbi:integumentary mucin C.1-like [Strongylocentrotus purpuratus]|uniref:EGF-like domain-containing protein n=1 Tax=Strongylocentrotus purpuratus TaxID=7668 RepID=A0A7M7PSQ4_STRPU|nr:integumentary mucin C.1-like [Strongylocentrotus purpuratus]